MWAITEFIGGNGATRVFLGSHLLAERTDPFAPYDTVPAEMAKGSVLVIVGSLWDGGAANRADGRGRRGSPSTIAPVTSARKRINNSGCPSTWYAASRGASRSWSATPSTSVSSATSVTSTREASG